MEGPKGSGKSTTLRALCSAIPALAPRVIPVYVNASTDWAVELCPHRSIGTAAWVQLRDDPDLKGLFKDNSHRLDKRLEIDQKGISLGIEIMPVLKANGW